MNSAEQVRHVLTEAKRKHRPFDEAWYTALRSLVPPADCSPEVRAEHDADKSLWREAKPYWRAAYEDRLPTDLELADGMRNAERRLNDLIESESET